MTSPSIERGLLDNLRRYRLQRVLAGLLFWFPTSILFFLERVDLSTTLRLGAAYFLGVVVLEVPSGWFSDRYSRVLTLRIGAASLVATHALFLLAGSSVATLFAAQLFLALAMSAMSGTDTSFHYDSLEALGRASEFGKREASASRDAFIATMAAALIGGALGWVDLRLPFVASLAAAMLQLLNSLRMVEPELHGAGEIAETEPPVRSLGRRMKTPALAWLLLFLTVQQPLESLAIDMMQPWLAETVGSSLSEAGNAPLTSGLLLAVISLVGAATAAKSDQLRQWLGLRGALTLLATIEAVILIALASTRSFWILPLLALRSTQAAAGPVLVAAGAAPLLARNQRATFLSIGSLAGRGAYGTLLLVLGTKTDLDDVLNLGALVGAACLGLLIIGAGLARARS